MQDSVFTKIIKGEIPCHKVYEDETTIAFLDIEPLFPGHTLIVPKAQVDQIQDLSSEDYQALFAAVRHVSRRLKDVLMPSRVVVQVLGFDVPHAHVHLVPTDSGTDFFRAITDHLNKDVPYPYQPTNEELADIAAKLRMDTER